MVQELAQDIGLAEANNCHGDADDAKENFDRIECDFNGDVV